MQTIRAPECVVGELLFEALRVKDDRLNGLAAEAFAAIGPRAAGRLIREAQDGKNPPAHRLRLLHAVERVGAVPDPDDRTLLFMLLHDRNARVREAAVRTIVRL